MTSPPPISISAHTARTLSFAQLQSWGSAGESLRDEFRVLVTDLAITLYRSSSPAKSLGAATNRLAQMFSRPGVRGQVRAISGRRIEFRLVYPTCIDQALRFSLVCGEINARTGALRFDLSTPMQMSLHALQRLYERLDEKSQDAVLEEVYSCLGLAIHWRKGATEAQARCWPLISKNGLFIGTNVPESDSTIAITWIKSDNIGRKWGLVLRNLNRLRELMPERLEDYIFAREFILSFPWMLHEHVPGEDSISLAWEQRNSEEQDSIVIEPALDEPIETETDDISIPPKLSCSYINGLNYSNTPPVFKTHTLHPGVVVQIRLDGSLIVGLQNGWVGHIPYKSIERGTRLIPEYQPPKLGQDVAVVLNKISHIHAENAYSLSLDPEVVSKASWEEIESEHSVGTAVTVELLSRYKRSFIAKLANGVRGLISDTEVGRFFGQPQFEHEDPIGKSVEAVVTGYFSEKKYLLLSIRDIELIPLRRSTKGNHQIGDVVLGKCIRNSGAYALVEMPSSELGILHGLNNWGRNLPAAGDEVSVVVMGTTDSMHLLSAEPPSRIDKIFFARPPSDDTWHQFVANYSVGDSIDVQILYWRESRQCYMVSTIDGIVGTIPVDELEWDHSDRKRLKALLNPGDVLPVSITSINQEKSRATFSKKALEKNPIDDVLVEIDQKSAIPGVVIEKVDYGYFVRLEPYKFDALLHRSKIQSGISYAEGEHLNVYIESIDLMRRRISLRTTPKDDVIS
jgi:ribosomal protein S1